MDPAPEGAKDIYIVALVLFGTVWALFAVPFIYHVIRAATARNAWLPFERKPNGRYAFMAQNRWFAAFRAPLPERRSTLGLVVRYLIWLWAIAALSFLPARYLADVFGS